MPTSSAWLGQMFSDGLANTPAASGHIRNQSSGSTISNSDTAQAPFKSRTMSTRHTEAHPCCVVMTSRRRPWRAPQMRAPLGSCRGHHRASVVVLDPKFQACLLLHGMGHGAPNHINESSPSATTLGKNG